MYWMFEPHSKSYDYDDGETYSPPMQWHEIPLAILLFILFLIYIVIIELLIPLGLLFHEFYSITKSVSESGKLDSPGLVVTGIVIAIILLTLISNHIFAISDHPFIAFCSSGFVLMFTIAPLTGLAMRYFKRK